LQNLFRRRAVRVTDPADIHAEVAHDALDDFPAKPVVVRQRVTLHRCEVARGNACRIAARSVIVLHISFGKLAYRAGAESEQHVGAVGGVALEFRRNRPTS